MQKKYLVTAEEMKRLDRYTIQELGIPGEILMERAALAVVDAIKEYLGPTKQVNKLRILAVCGGGNNGGDGLAVARLLTDLGAKVDILFLGDAGRVPRETALQLTILKKYGLSMVSFFPDAEYHIIVDAIFGIGLSRPAEGKYLDAIRRINASGAFKVAVDVPSGVDADTGQVHFEAVKAHMTVTFGYCKRGLMYYPGHSHVGKICCRDIGIGERSFDGIPPEMFTLTDAPDLAWPRRIPQGNKGDFGKILLLAGSENMAGAALLCGESLLRCGAGMVKICTPQSNRVIFQKKLPEAMLLTYSRERIEEETIQELDKALKWADCVVAGPGLGTGSEKALLLEQVLRGGLQPLVLDADALNLLSASERLKEILSQSVKDGRRGVVLTPHPGELSRLLGCSIQEVKAYPEKMARSAAAAYEAVVVSKDARTLVCGNTGSVYMNTAGNSGMATAGSGDVLAGVIGAMLGAGMEPYEGAVAGTYLHACAGDYSAKKKGVAGMIASDLLRGLTAIQPKLQK